MLHELWRACLVEVLEEIVDMPDHFAGGTVAFEISRDESLRSSGD